MAKGGKKSITAEQRATERALRIAYQVGRYEWLNGRAPMSPSAVPVAIPAPPAPATLPPKPKGRPSYWDASVERVLGSIQTDGVSTAVITRKVRAALSDEIKQSGRSPPNRGLIGRKLGRWHRRTPAK
jgi:hypothetical protein